MIFYHVLTFVSTSKINTAHMNKTPAAAGSETDTALGSTDTFVANAGKLHGKSLIRALQIKAPKTPFTALAVKKTDGRIPINSVNGKIWQ